MYHCTSNALIVCVPLDQEVVCSLVIYRLSAFTSPPVSNYSRGSFKSHFYALSNSQTVHISATSWSLVRRPINVVIKYYYLKKLVYNSTTWPPLKRILLKLTCIRACLNSNMIIVWTHERITGCDQRRVTFKMNLDQLDLHPPNSGLYFQDSLDQCPVPINTNFGFGIFAIWKKLSLIPVPNNSPMVGIEWYFSTGHQLGESCIFLCIILCNLHTVFMFV